MPEVCLTVHLTIASLIYFFSWQVLAQADLTAIVPDVNQHLAAAGTVVLEVDAGHLQICNESHGEVKAEEAHREIAGRVLHDEVPLVPHVQHSGRIVCTVFLREKIKRLCTEIKQAAMISCSKLCTTFTGTPVRNNHAWAI